jgi:hypothetical protein
VKSAVADETHLPTHEQNPDAQATLRQQTLTALYRLRQQAEDEKKVVKGHGHLDYLGVVEFWLNALVGNRPEYFHPEDISPGTPLHELATFYNGPPRAAASDPPQQRETWNVEPETSSVLPETWNVEPETSTASNPSTASNLTPPAQPPFEPQLEPTPHLAPPSSIPNPQSQIHNSYHRRLAHQRKLELLREASRRGLPIQLEFDPEDGPVPSPHYHLDDYGHQPSPPPTKEEDTQMIKDYLAKLRAECRANA